VPGSSRLQSVAALYNGAAVMFSPAHQAQEGRQGAPLLEHCRESPDRRRPGGASGRCCTWARSTIRRKLAWRKSIAILEEGALQPRTRSLFSGGTAARDCLPGRLDRSVAAKRTAGCAGPRQWGGCWLALSLWRELELDCFLGRTAAAEPQEACPCEGRGARGGDRVLLLLATYPACWAPGSEWRLHREWFERSAMADLGSAKTSGWPKSTSCIAVTTGCSNTSRALFDHLVGRWRDLFNISFDVLLYDLTSTYFEADPPFAESDKRRHGYSRDHRPDCVAGRHRLGG